MIYPRVQSKKLTDSARGKECTMMHPTQCNGNAETVVLCHIPRPFMGATGGKTSDFCGFYGCSGCHTWFDGPGRNSPESFEYALDAMMKTLHIMHSDGLITFKGEK